jgi:hypothetical protein
MTKKFVGLVASLTRGKEGKGGGGGGLFVADAGGGMGKGVKEN